MDDQSVETGAGQPDDTSLAYHLAMQPTLTNAVNQAGLGEIARTVRGDAFTVCDLNTHGVQGCADMRAAAEHQKMAAELVAIGLALCVAAMVGSIAVGFVKLVTIMAHPRGQHRVYALFPRRKGRSSKGEMPWRA